MWITVSSLFSSLLYSYLFNIGEMFSGTHLSPHFILVPGDGPGICTPSGANFLRPQVMTSKMREDHWGSLGTDLGALGTLSGEWPQITPKNGDKGYRTQGFWGLTPVCILAYELVFFITVNLFSSFHLIYMIVSRCSKWLIYSLWWLLSLSLYPSYYLFIILLSSFLLHFHLHLSLSSVQ